MKSELPIIGAFGGILVDVLVTGGDFLLWLFLSVSELVPILSMVSSYLAPTVEWIPQGTVETLFLGVVALSVGISIGQLIESYKNDA